MKNQLNVHFSFILFILCLMTFFPLLDVGFTTNDDTHIYYFFHLSLDHLFSQIFNLFKVSFHVFTTTTRPSIGNLLLSPILNLINFSYTNPFVMRILSILFHVINIAIFYKIISEIFKDKNIGIIASILFFVFIQNSWEHNILVSYITYAFLFSLVLLSIYFFLIYLKTEKLSYQMASGILFLLALSYEINVVYLPVFLFLSLIHNFKKNSIKRLLSDSKMHLILITLFIIIFFIFRLNASSDVKNSVAHDSSASNQTIETLGYYFAIGRDRWFLILKTIYKFGISTFPAYIFLHAKTFLNEYSENYNGHTYTLISILNSLQPLSIVKSFIATFSIYHLLQTFKESAKKNLIIPGIIISLYLIFAPGLPLSLIYKYQEWVKLGVVSFTSSYNSFFGMVVLIIISIYHLFYLLNKLENNNLKTHLQHLSILLICFITSATSVITDYTNSAYTKSQIQSQKKWDLYNKFLTSDLYKTLPDNSVIYAPTLFDSIGIVANFKPYWTDYTNYKTGNWKNILNFPELIPTYLKDPKVTFDYTKSKNILIINSFENLKPHLQSKNLYFLKYAQEKKDPNQYILFAKVTDFINYETEADFYSDEIWLLQLSKYRQFLIFGQSENPTKLFSYVINKEDDFNETSQTKIGLPKINLESVGVSNYIQTKFSSNDLSVQFENGFYQDEITHRWSDKISKLNLINRSAAPITIEITFSVNNFSNEKSQLRISTDTIFINKEETHFTKKISLKAHANQLLEFESAAPKINAPLDPRNMYFMMKNFKLSVLK